MPDTTIDAVDVYAAAAYWSHRALRDKAIDQDTASDLAARLRTQAAASMQTLSKNGTDNDAEGIAAQLDDVDVRARVAAFAGVAPPLAEESFDEFLRLHTA